MSTKTNYESLKQRSLNSMVAVGARQVVGQGLNILGNIVLARLLSPAEFGVYALLQFVGSLLTTLVGSGLGASLVRQPNEPAHADFRAVAVLQFSLSLFFAAVLTLTAPTFVRIYGIEHKGSLELFAIAGLAYVILSFQTVPQARLERELNFRAVAFLELAQIVAFNAVLVIAAWRGLGGLSFAAGILARAIVGAIGFQRLAPSPFGLGGVTLALAKKHLAYGIPFQGVNIISAAKDSIVPLFIAAFLGAKEVGFINWASMLAVYPALILMIVSRVYLPTFARMQENREELGGFLSSVLQASFLLVAPLATATLIFSEPITVLVFGSQWQPALPLFYFLWLANLVVPATTALLAFLNAAGKLRHSLVFATICLLATWGLGVPAVRNWGAVGYAGVNAVVQLATVYLWWQARRVALFSVVRNALVCWATALAAGGVCWGLCKFHEPSTLAELVAFLLLFLVLYLGFAFAVVGERIRLVLALLGVDRFYRVLPTKRFWAR